MNVNSEHIILFDGVCNLCNGVVKFIIQRDKTAKFKFAPLQSQSGKELLKISGLAQDSFDTFIYLRCNKVLSKSTAALYLMKDLRGICKLLFTGIIIPRFIRDFFYGIVAKSRYKIWGRKDACMIPTDDIKSRFLV